MAAARNGKPSDNLYVKGLPDEFDDEAMNLFFGAAGTVISAKALGHGAALVRFDTEDTATMVREAMNQQQPAGCTQKLVVRYAVSYKGDGSEDWYCSQCGEHVFAKSKVCRWCGIGNVEKDGWGNEWAVASDAGGKGGGKGNDSWGAAPAEKPDWWVPEQQPGDWWCPDCGDLQFAKNNQCRQCKCPKGGWQSFGKVVHEEPKGKGDWGSPYGGQDRTIGKGAGKAFEGYKKTKLCTSFDTGTCYRGDSCKFAHGADDLGSPQGDGSYAAKGSGKGKVAKPPPDASKIKGLIDGLMTEGLPGANFDQDKHALYVTNLPHDTTNADLYVVFAAFGALPPRGVKVMPTQPGNRTYAFVNFMEQANCDFALMALNGVTQPDGAKLVVKPKTKKSDMVAVGAGGLAAYSGFADAAAAAPPGVTPAMMMRLQKKLSTGMMSSYDVSQWYILEYLGHVTSEAEMKSTCDQLLAACSHLGLG